MQWCKLPVLLLAVSVLTAVHFKFGRRSGLLLTRLSRWGSICMCTHPLCARMYISTYVCMQPNGIDFFSSISFSWRHESVPHFAERLALSARPISLHHHGVKQHVILNIDQHSLSEPSQQLAHAHAMHECTYTCTPTHMHALSYTQCMNAHVPHTLVRTHTHVHAYTSIHSHCYCVCNEFAYVTITIISQIRMVHIYNLLQYIMRVMRLYCVSGVFMCGRSRSTCLLVGYSYVADLMQLCSSHKDMKSAGSL